MKAAAYELFGPPEVVAIREVPLDDEVLIRIHAATVTTADWRIRSRNVLTGFGLQPLHHLAEVEQHRDRRSSL